MTEALVLLLQDLLDLIDEPLEGPVSYDLSDEPALSEDLNGGGPEDAEAYGEPLVLRAPEGVHLDELHPLAKPLGQPLIDWIQLEALSTYGVPKFTTPGSSALRTCLSQASAWTSTTLDI